jgi:Transposase DDE domain
MHTTASLPPDQYSTVLGRLPADLDLDALARQTKAIERHRKLGTGAGLLRLALARGPGGLSLSATAAWATMIGFPPMSDPGIKYRLDKAAGFLEAVMQSQLAAKSPGACVRWPGRILRASDGSCVSKRGSKGTDWRVHAVYDLGRGGFSHLDLTDGHGAEAIDRGAPVAGEIRIGDRNYATAPSLHRFRQQSADQADFIVRVRWNGFSLSRRDGRDFDLIEHLGSLPNDTVPHEAMVQAKLGPLDPPLPLRLIIQRKSPEATEATRKKLLSEATRRQKTLDPRSLVAAEFMILGTSLPVAGYPAAEILAVYRLRWQIELAFKRLKSLLHIDKLPTWTEDASRSWLYAHLIMALLCDDLSQEVLESFP